MCVRQYADTFVSPEACGNVAFDLASRRVAAARSYKGAIQGGLREPHLLARMVMCLARFDVSEAERVSHGRK